MPTQRLWESAFPFLFGRAFIEAGLWKLARLMLQVTFLRPGRGPFIEASISAQCMRTVRSFPYLFVGTFIKALRSRRIMKDSQLSDFPTVL